MSNTQPMTGLLKLALLADAVASGMTGILLAGGAGLITGLLGLPEDFMRYVGLFCVAYGLFVAYVGTRSAMPSPVILLIIIGNTLWAAGSIALLISGLLSPTMLGYLFVTAQAIVVAALAAAQQIGLRQAQLHSI